MYATRFKVNSYYTFCFSVVMCTYIFKFLRSRNRITNFLNTLINFILIQYNSAGKKIVLSRITFKILLKNIKQSGYVTLVTSFMIPILILDSPALGTTLNTCIISILNLENPTIETYRLCYIFFSLSTWKMKSNN